MMRKVDRDRDRDDRGGGFRGDREAVSVAIAMAVAAVATVVTAVRAVRVTMPTCSGGGVTTSWLTAGARRPFFRRRKTCPFSGPTRRRSTTRTSKLLQRYVSERGKIVPSRITAVSAKKQRELAQRDQARALPRPAALRDPLTNLSIRGVRAADRNSS